MTINTVLRPTDGSEPAELTNTTTEFRDETQ